MGGGDVIIKKNGVVEKNPVTLKPHLHFEVAEGVVVEVVLTSKTVTCRSQDGAFFFVFKMEIFFCLAPLSLPL